MRSMDVPLREPERVHRWMMLAVLALAAATRVHEALRTRLWFDEIYTLWIARRPLPALLASVGRDIHPPLHYILVWAWRGLGGEGDLWIKSLSILAGLATVALVYAAGRDLFGRGAGLFAAVLLALHPMHVGVSQESRSYALLSLLLAFSTWHAWRWIRQRPGADGPLYVAGAAAALYTHYVAAPVLALVGLWGLFASGSDRRLVPRWIALHALIAILFAPQIPTVLVQLARLRADHWVKAASVSGLINLFRLLSFGTPFLIVPLLALAALPLLRGGQRRAGALLWMGSLLPVLALWAMAMRGAGLFVERYMLFVLPAWCLLLAAGVMGLPRPWMRMAFVPLLLLFDVRALVRHTPQAEAVEMARLETHLALRVRPGDLVLHADAHSLLYSRHYALDPGDHRLFLPDPDAPPPYYEGDLVIPAPWRVTAEDFERLRSSGRPWWGVATRYGYGRADSAAARLAAYAAGPVWHDGRAMAWAGTLAAATRDSARR